MLVAVTLSLLLLDIGNISANQCSQKRYDAIIKGGPSLPDDEIISRHNITSLFVMFECHNHCNNKLECVGFNYRTTKNVENCQLTNVTRKKEETKTGDWMLMQDVEATKKEAEKAKVTRKSGLHCADLYGKGNEQSGIYEINPDGKGSFKVFCDMTTSGGGWTVFQRRLDGSVDFYRGWQDYKQGFGNLSAEYWLGLDKIQRMTNISQNELRIDMEDTSGNTRYAHYDSFKVSSESEKYKLNVGGYNGTAGDSLSYHNGMAFTTKDSDNDNFGVNCAVTFKGAWWYGHCHYSNLNGLYHNGAHTSNADGVNWYHWKGYHYSLKSTSMKIRPREFGKKK
ncbi:microfibril-associated glycoprotein 4-like [Dendronephthya gigantea]|uniref:microfibril-associated glycoprotein 4-like n=1 Tax=Dendronephthya gigantea TaxID=151771 RepID=UPI00106BD5B4|nr:microfibril-associated glycoprotein 4-like [Dendronephthya gigantea]